MKFDVVEVVEYQLFGRERKFHCVCVGEQAERALTMG
jgi:hypothetical protein